MSGPRIVQLRGRLLPVAPRGGRHPQAALFVAECACGWRGTSTSSETAARREAITHQCRP